MEAFKVTPPRAGRVYGLKPPAAGKRARPGAGPCIATARDFVCQSVLKKRAAARPAGGGAPAPGAHPAQGVNPSVDADQGAAATPQDGRAGSAERGKSAAAHLFHDEGLNSFFRRLAWSPEGAPSLTRSGPARPRACPATSVPVCIPVFRMGHRAAMGRVRSSTRLCVCPRFP